MGRRKVATATPLPKALVCGLLEDEGRILFLVRKDAASGIERIELPCILVQSGRSPFAEVKEKFPKLTGIDSEIGEPITETSGGAFGNARYNAGSRKRRAWVPILVFKVTAKRMNAKPSQEFSGFKWLSLEKAKNERLSRNAEWLRSSK